MKNMIATVAFASIFATSAFAGQLPNQDEAIAEVKAGIAEIVLTDGKMASQDQAFKEVSKGIDEIILTDGKMASQDQAFAEVSEGIDQIIWRSVSMDKEIEKVSDAISELAGE